MNETPTPRTDAFDIRGITPQTVGTAISFRVAALHAHACELERKLAEANRKLAERLISFCVCTGQQSPVPLCTCVSCSIARLEQERDQWRSCAERLALAGQHAVMECVLEHQSLRDAISAYRQLEGEAK